MLKRRTFLMSAATVAALPTLPGAIAFAQEDGTLSVAVVSDPVTLDPALMASFFEIAVQYNIFEPLIHITPELEAEPGLASVETPDPTTYVLTLKEGLTFHDGTPDRRRGGEGELRPDDGPRHRLAARQRAGPGGVGRGHGPARGDDQPLGARTRPFLQVLSNRAGMMVSPTAVEELGEDFATQAVGAGPYRVASWTKNSELVLEAFPGYWRGEPAIKRIVFRPIPDETVRLTNLRSGTVQLIDGVPPQALSQVTSTPGIELKQSPGLGFSAFSFNTTRAPFDDPALRRAFAMATDPTVIVQAAYFGAATPAFGPIPPSMPWAWDPDLTAPRNDPEGARAALEEAGVTTPVPVEITVTNSPIFVRIAEILQAQANAAGFDVSINQIDATSLITVLRERTFDLCMSPWSGRTDPDGNMYNYFTIDGPNNFPGWENEEVDGLLEQARTETTQEARAALYQQAQEIIAEETPLLFVAFPMTLQASVEELDWTQYPDGALRLQFATFE